MERDLLPYAVVVLVGGLVLVSALARPPAGECVSVPEGDAGGVHVDPDGTMDYYDGCRLHPGAVGVFLALTTVGTLSVGLGTWRLVNRSRNAP